MTRSGRMLLLSLAAPLWLLTPTPPDARACSVAHNVRRFPLGTSRGRLVVLELAHFRDRARGGRRGDDWSGKARLRFYALRGGAPSATVIALGKVRLSDRSYVKDLRPVLLRAHGRAKRLPGFRALGAPTLAFCDFTRTCGGITTGAAATGRVQLTRGAGRGRTPRAVPWPASVRTNPNVGLPAGTLATAPVADRRALAGFFRISSVRTWRLGRRTLVVANVATGIRKFAYPILKTWPRSKCAAARTCAYPEQTLHHGVAFDALILF